MGRNLLQPSVGCLPNAGGRRLVQHVINAKGSREFQVGPVPEGVAQQLWHRLGVGQKLVIGISVAGDVAFWHPGGPQGPPFVVVTSEPDFSQVVPLLVLCNFLRQQVAMIVVDRLVRGDRVKLPGGVGGQ